MINGLTQKEDMLINTYASKIRAHKHIHQIVTELMRKTDISQEW
jgi:hypothetical protein